MCLLMIMLMSVHVDKMETRDKWGVILYQEDHGKEIRVRENEPLRLKLPKDGIYDFKFAYPGISLISIHDDGQWRIFVLDVSYDVIKRNTILIHRRGDWYRSFYIRRR